MNYLGQDDRTKQLVVRRETQKQESRGGYRCTIPSVPASLCILELAKDLCCPALGSGLLLLVLVAPAALAEPFQNSSFRENQCLPSHSHSVNQNPSLEKAQINQEETISPPSVAQCEAAQSVEPVTVAQEKELVSVGEAGHSPGSLDKLLDSSVGSSLLSTAESPHPPLSASLRPLQEVAPVTTDVKITPPVVADTPVIADELSPNQLEQDSVEINEASSPDDAMEQVTSVSQLSDVKPTDWAFQALQSLVERYGCIAGYPDGTFRGNQTMTGYEFAAGLNACLDRITERATQDDLLTLQRLQQEFATELANLRGRVDALEARTSQVAANQFSSTAFLGGQVILGLATAAGGNPPGRGETNTILNYLTQLQLVSSFTGKDVLRVGLATGNFDNRGFANPNSLNTNMSLLSYQTDLDNQFQLNSLEYRFATFGDRVVFTFKPVGFSLSSVLSPNSPYFDAGEGAISRFAAVNPVFRIGNLDAGLGFDWLLSDKARLQFAYGTRNSGNAGDGLFGAKHNALGVQLLLNPNPNLIAGLAYVNAYSSDGRLDTFTGSNNADTSGGFNEPAQIHALSATLQWRLAANTTFGAWGGVILTDATFGAFVDAILSRSIDLDELNALTLTSTYLFSLGISDPFGRKGDFLAFLVGQPLKLNLGVLIEDVDKGNSLHYEMFYRFRLNDNISITPGFFFVTDPGHISRNDTIFVGTIRTTFTF